MKTEEDQFIKFKNCLMEIQGYIRKQDYIAASFMLGKLHTECDENIKHLSNEPDTEETEFTLDDLMDRLKGSTFTLNEIEKLLKFVYRRMEI